MEATVLGFDFGEKRIGVAAGQTISRTATPLAVIHVRHGGPDWRAIAALVRQYEPQLLVVGMPVTADGSEHVLAPRVRRFCNQLRKQYRLPVHLIDEHLSSHEASERLDGDDRNIDAVAAQVILETWLNENRPR